MPKQARFKPVVACFGPLESPKCLENTLFCDPKKSQKWVKNVFVQRWSWTIWDAQTSEMSVVWARFEPFWPIENPSLETAVFWHQNWVKKWVKNMFFQK